MKTTAMEKKVKTSRGTHTVFSETVMLAGNEIIDLLKRGLIEKTEAHIAERGLEAAEHIAGDFFTREYFHNLFTYLEVNIPENLREKLSAEVQEIIFEGQLLCCMESGYGADLKKIRRISKDILKKRGH